MRQVLAVVVAVLVLGGAVGGAYWWLDQQASAEADVSAPDATVDSYLDAWSAGDHEAMRAVVRDPADEFVARHEQLRDGLDAGDLWARRLDLVEDVDGRATATAEVMVEVPEVGPVSWEVELGLLRERGEWGIAWGGDALHPDWEPGTRFDVIREEVERAPILAADDTVLAGPAERVTFGFEPSGVDDADEVVDAFEAAIEGSGATAERLLSQGGLVDGWFYPVASVPADQAREARSAFSGVCGILRRAQDGARSLLADGFAVHLVGRVDEATAEQLDQLGGPYERGDQVGQFGLEETLEPQLATGEAITVALRDGAQGPIRTTLATARVARDGATEVDPGPARTTLDVAVQRAIENTLLGHEDEAAIAVVDGDDGAIRGSASRPLDGFDRATGGRYPPGDAFMLVTTEARVAEGLDPDAALTAEALTDAAERFGFGVEPRLPVTAFGGSFPPPVEADVPGATAGQAQVEVSPLHLASMAAAATSGTWHVPYLLERDADGESRQLAEGALDAVRGLLTDSVSETADGTGLVGFTAGADASAGPVTWFVGTVDDLGVAVLIEDGDAESAAGLAARFARELQALRDAPADVDGDDLP